MNTKIIIAVAVVGGVTALIALMNLNDERKEITDTEVQVQDLSEATIPQNMPDIPTYPGSVMQNVQNNVSDTERNVTLSLATEDAVSDVILWYRGALNEDGWAVVGDKNVGGYVLLEGEREQVKTFVQAASRSELGKTVITQRVRIR